MKLNAWDKKEKKMLQIGMIDLYTRTIYNAASKGFTKSYSTLGAFDDWGHPDDLIFLRYTGFKDCKGTEIWEGHIISYTDDPGDPEMLQFGKVEWKAEHGVWFVPDVDTDLWELVFYYEVEVAGNVFEDPELVR